MLYPRTGATNVEVETRKQNDGEFRGSRVQEGMNPYIFHVSCFTFMRIGICTIWLTISESHSLKQKRRVVKSITDRLKKRFNIAVAEIDALDVHQRVVLGVVSVSNNSKHLNRVLSHVVNFIEETGLAELTDYQIEILS